MRVDACCRSGLRAGGGPGVVRVSATIRTSSSSTTVSADTSGPAVSSGPRAPRPRPSAAGAGPAAPVTRRGRRRPRPSRYGRPGNPRRPVIRAAVVRVLRGPGQYAADPDAPPRTRRPPPPSGPPRAGSAARCPARYGRGPGGRVRVDQNHRAGRRDPGQRELVAGVPAAGPEEHDGLRHGCLHLPRGDGGQETPRVPLPIGGTRGGSDLALRAVILTHGRTNCQR